MKSQPSNHDLLGTLHLNIIVMDFWRAIFVANHDLQYNEEVIVILEESVDNDHPIVNIHICTLEMSDIVEFLQGDRQQQTEVELHDLEMYCQDMVEDLATENATLMDYVQCSPLNIPFFLMDLPILKLANAARFPK
jgi:hypothetical protein